MVEVKTHRPFLASAVFIAVVIIAVIFDLILIESLSGQHSFAQSQTQPSVPVRAACATDVKALCADVEPGAGRIVQCMDEKRDRLSEGCKSAIAAARAQHRP